MTALAKLLRTTAFKLSVLYVALFALLAGAVVAYLAFHANILVNRQITGTINAEISGLAEQYRTGGLRGLVEAVEARSLRPGASLYLVATPTGDPIAGNVGALPTGTLDERGWLEADYRGVRDAEQAGAADRAIMRIFLLPGGFRLLVGRDIEERERFGEIITRVAQGAIGLIVVLGLIGGVFVSRRVLKRIDAVTEASRTIMAGNFEGRIPVTGSGDEFDRLAESLNAMLVRIAALMRGLQEVSDNIAHDLKTPLTRLRNRAEAALRDAGSAEDYQAALGQMIEESDHLIRTFDALLMIARAEAGHASDTFERIDLSAIVRDLVELYEPLAEERGGAIRHAVGDRLAVRGNRELLGQAMANLLDNAVKYGFSEGADAAILVEGKQTANGVEIVVADAGPGIAAAERSRVLERFVRLETSRSLPGSGLGLSLVAAVARLHGGVLVLEDNQPGLRARLTLPADAGTRRTRHG